MKEIQEHLSKLEKRFSNFRKYLCQDDFEHRNIRDVRNLFARVALNETAFNQLIDEDYYRPIKTKSAFNGNYIK